MWIERTGKQEAKAREAPSTMLVRLKNFALWVSVSGLSQAKVKWPPHKPVRELWWRKDKRKDKGCIKSTTSNNDWELRAFKYKSVQAIAFKKMVTSVGTDLYRRKEWIQLKIEVQGSAGKWVKTGWPQKLRSQLGNLPSSDITDTRRRYANRVVGLGISFWSASRYLQSRRIWRHCTKGSLENIHHSISQAYSEVVISKGESQRANWLCSQVNDGDLTNRGAIRGHSWSGSSSGAVSGSQVRVKHIMNWQVHVN